MASKSPKKAAAAVVKKPTCPNGHPLRVDAGMHVCTECTPRYMAHILE